MNACVNSQLIVCAVLFKRGVCETEQFVNFPWQATHSTGMHHICK